MKDWEKGYLLEFVLEREKVSSFAEYPFSLPAISQLRSLPLHPKVTFFIGENGSGKSTVLEAIAQAVGLNPEGGTRNTLFSTADTHSILFENTLLIRSHKIPKDSYFLRAESFYNLASFMDDGRAEYLWTYGGKSLHEQSHGESFMATMTNKLRGAGIYLFDEPEAALSPSRQLAALAVFNKLVKLDSQLIIATHSPILMAYPDALIYHFSEEGIHPISYKETEHYAITKEFLNKPEKILGYLFEESSGE
ncbi:MAG: AAA family ATPase [Blastocatellia bacterium]